MERRGIERTLFWLYEVLKKILNIGIGLDGYIFILDLLNLKFRLVKLKKRNNCLCG